MNTTTYITFSAIDYKGIDSLSSYALPITPFIFIPDTENTINTKMVWDFGDGTITKAFSAEKFYEFPGIYIITLIQYDCNNNAMISSVTKTVQIYDYFPLSFGVKAYDSDGNELTTLDYQVGQIEGPLRISYTFPWYQPQLDVYYDIYNSDSFNYWDINSNKYAHLETFNTMYDKIYNYSLSSYQFSEITKISPTPQPIFLKLLNGVITPCLSSDSYSCFAGLTSIKDAYFKEDTITNNLLIDLFFDKTKYVNPYNRNFNYLNNLGITLSANIGNNTPSHLSITSNGLDGEGYPINSFNINPVKFYGVKIPFVVKVKDFENFSVKNFETIPLSAFNIIVYEIVDVQLATEAGEILLDELGNEIYATGIYVPLSTVLYSISSLNYTLSSQGTGGSFRGYIYFPENTEPLFNIKIALSANLVNDQLSSYYLRGSTTAFNIYPLEYFDAYKKNEDFNAAETLKNLRFQEILLDKTVLFDDFFGGVLGGDSLDHEDIGVKTYEASANFVQNTQDIDNCVVDALNSMGEFMGYNDVYEERYQYPVKVKRLVDLLSIDKVKLLGYENKFLENFDIKGRTSKDIFGINIGDKLDTTTYVISSNTPIVALEKFSNEYVLLNTFQPVSATGSYTYPLSTYTNDWGWPLVLPTTLNFEDIEKYYIFFDFINIFDNTILDGVLDFNNPKTTIPFPTTTFELNDLNGIKEHIFLDTLYQSLSIVQ